MSGPLLLAGAIGAIGLAIALMVLVFFASPAKRGIPAAITAIDERYGQRAAGTARRSADPVGTLPTWLRRLALRLSPSNIAASLQHRVDLAGNPPAWTADRILAVKGLGLLVLAVLGGAYGLHSVPLLILCAGGAAIGFFLPDVLLYNAGAKRQAQIQAGLPDALDMLTVCVEAGLGFDASMAQVARNTSGPLAAEIARALQEMQIGKSRAQALRGMVDRTNVPELRAFVSSLVQASELGIAIAAVLREQAREMRVKRRHTAEEKAQKVPVKLLFPLIFCLFPGLFVVVIGPGIIRISQVLFHHG